MVPEKIPARLQKKLAGREIQMLIPAYPIKKIASYKYFEKYDQWWLLIDSANRVSICKAAVGKDQLYELGITSTMQNKIFINKAIRFVEIFSVPGEKNIGKKFSLIKKDLHFVVSKDYVQYYDEIKNRSGFVDYAEYSKSMKERQENQGNINPMAQKV